MAELQLHCATCDETFSLPGATQDELEDAAKKALWRIGRKRMNGGPRSHACSHCRMKQII